ncbi:ribokinase [Suicoccus acidiformans]|uniref:Ribokinase n=1 Tax=Suicoccus acidiformans TaxID=2036206 RepID=A0A347WIP0_9LACT|nr:ribokinase [Suicoccus acidiformans]AXY24947.1 ribokinase [Suicoccus acidiformans]
MEGNDIAFSFGGKGANQAIAAARLGASTTMIGAVGTDVFGDNLVENLKENNVDTSKVIKVDIASGTALIQLIEKDNSIIYIPGANAKFAVENLKEYEEFILQAKIVILQNELTIQVVEAVIDLCYRRNIAVLYNPAPAKHIDKSYLDKVSYLTPNETEFSVLFPNQTLEDVLKKYPNKVIVTLGSKGAIFHDGASIQEIPAIFTENVVDTTGAGDCFNGAFAAGIINNLDIENAIKFANIASSISIQHFGAQSGYPTINQIKEHPQYEEAWNFKQ